MRVLDQGHTYELRTLDGVAHAEARYLRFVKREGPGYPGNMGHHPGTTSQEVLRALIDRGEYVNRQVPCLETESAIQLMRAALFLLELRAARRHGRHLALATIDQLEDMVPCERCGHVGCAGDACMAVTEEQPRTDAP